MSINACVCYECGTILVSKHRHDFQECSCPQHTFTDGGPDGGYIRRGGMDLTKVIDLTQEDYDFLSSVKSKKRRQLHIESLYQKQLVNPMSTANQCRPKASNYPPEVKHVYTLGNDYRFIVKATVVDSKLSDYANYDLYIEKKNVDALGNVSWVLELKTDLPNPNDCNTYVDRKSNDLLTSYLKHLAAMLLYGKHELLADCMKEEK